MLCCLLGVVCAVVRGVACCVLCAVCLCGVSVTMLCVLCCVVCSSAAHTHTFTVSSECLPGTETCEERSCPFAVDSHTDEALGVRLDEPSMPIDDTSTEFPKTPAPPQTQQPQQQQQQQQPQPPAVQEPAATQPAAPAQAPLGPVLSDDGLPMGNQLPLVNVGVPATLRGGHW